MTQKTAEQILERHKALSPGLAEAFVSEEKGEMLWLIGEVHHLDEERIKKVAGIVGYIILGFAHPEDLAREIAAEARVDKRLADELAHEIRLKILNPIIPELDRFYGHYGGSVAAAVPAAPATPPQPSSAPRFAEATRGKEPTADEAEALKPAFSEDRPFILHEERGGVERARPRDETLVRPSFYEETSDQEPGTRGIERVRAARLEIGGVGEEKTKEPQMGKTEEPPIRVVHYSGPQTPVDPFSPQQMAKGEEQKVGPQQPPKDIHPENIVDLKDLPR